MNVQSGYGFVHFTSDQAGIASAFRALSEVHNTTVNNVLYNVEASKNLLKQFKDTTPSIKSTVKSQAKPVRTRTQTNSFDSSLSSSMLGTSTMSYIGLNDGRPSGFSLKPASGHSRTPSNESLLSNGSGSGSSGMYSPYTHQQRGISGNTYATVPPPTTRSGNSVAHTPAFYTGNPNGSGSGTGVYPPRSTHNTAPPAVHSGAYPKAGLEYGHSSPYSQPRSLPIDLRSAGYTLPSAGGAASNSTPHQYLSTMGNVSSIQTRNHQQPSSLYNQASLPTQSYSHMNAGKEGMLYTGKEGMLYTGKEGMLYARPQDSQPLNRGAPSHQRSPQQHQSPLYQQQHQPLQQQQQHQPLQQPQYQQQQHKQQHQQQHYPQYQQHWHHTQQQSNQRHHQQQQLYNNSIHEQPYRQSSHSIPTSQRSAHSIPSSSRPPSLPLPPPRSHPTQGYPPSERSTYGGGSSMLEPQYQSSVLTRMATEGGRDVSVPGVDIGYSGAHQRQPSGRSPLSEFPLWEGGRYTGHINNYNGNNNSMGAHHSGEARVPSNVWSPHTDTASIQYPSYLHNTTSSIDSTSTDLDEIYSSSHQATRSSDEYNSRSPQSLTAFLRSTNTELGISLDSGSIDRSTSHDLSQYSGHSVGQHLDPIVVSQRQHTYRSTEDPVHVVDLQDLDLSAWTHNKSSRSSEIPPNHNAATLSACGTTDSESGIYTGSSTLSSSTLSGRSFPSITSMTGTKTIGPPMPSTATSNPSYTSYYNSASFEGGHRTNTHNNNSLLQLQQQQSPPQRQQDNIYLVSPSIENTFLLPEPTDSAIDYSPNPSYTLDTTVSNMSLSDSSAFHNNNNIQGSNNTTTTINNHHSNSIVVEKMSTNVHNLPTKLI